MSGHNVKLRLVASKAAPTLTKVERHQLGARLLARSVRRACFSSQLEASEKLGYPLRSIARYESGASKVDGGYLHALLEYASAHGVEVVRPVLEAA